MIWLYFAGCAPVITVAGIKLTRYGDAIANKTGLGGVWIGVVLAAAVTSLPELVTGVSAIIVADSPDIAVGDVLGSCVFNLLIIVVFARTIYRYEARQLEKFAEAEADRYPGVSLRQIVIRYAVAGIFVVIAGSFLPAVGPRLPRV